MSNAITLSRRLLMKVGGLAAVAGYAKPSIAPGVQLYTVRNEVLKEPLATLHAIAEIGYREVEMMRSQVKTLAPLLKGLRLAPISLHFETPLLTGNWTAWQHADMPPIEAGVTFEDSVLLARDHGFRYIVFNYLAPEERLGLDFYRSLADKLNSAARKADAAGLRFCYHNHDFEFQPKPGGTPMHVLLKHLDPKLIRLEVDAFWVSMAGVNAAEFLRNHADRIELVHLKDRAKGTPIHYDIATVPKDTYRELGSGPVQRTEVVNHVEVRCRGREECTSEVSVLGVEWSIPGAGVHGAVLTDGDAATRPYPGACAISHQHLVTDPVCRIIDLHRVQARAIAATALRRSRVNEAIVQIQAPSFRKRRHKLVGAESDVTCPELKPE